MELIPTDYVIFDAPLGRKHPATGQYIDYSIFLNTPLDVALARRVLRDYRDKTNQNITELLHELDVYLATTRPLYTIDYERNEIFDYVINGNQAVNILVAEIVDKIRGA